MWVEANKESSNDFLELLNRHAAHRWDIDCGKCLNLSVKWKSTRQIGDKCTAGTWGEEAKKWRAPWLVVGTECSDIPFYLYTLNTRATLALIWMRYIPHMLICLLQITLWYATHRYNMCVSNALIKPYTQTNCVWKCWSWKFALSALVIYASLLATAVASPRITYNWSEPQPFLFFVWPSSVLMGKFAPRLLKSGDHMNFCFSIQTSGLKQR